MIPKIIHQTGPEDKKLWPAEWEYATASWKKVYSEHEHMKSSLSILMCGMTILTIL